MRFSVLANPIYREALKIAKNLQSLLGKSILYAVCQNTFATLGFSFGYGLLGGALRRAQGRERVLISLEGRALSRPRNGIRTRSANGSGLVAPCTRIDGPRGGAGAPPSRGYGEGGGGGATGNAWMAGLAMRKGADFLERLPPLPSGKGCPDRNRLHSARRSCPLPHQCTFC